jgi:hypothetical protein
MPDASVVRNVRLAYRVAIEGRSQGHPGTSDHMKRASIITWSAIGAVVLAGGVAAAVVLTTQDDTPTPPPGITGATATATPSPSSSDGATASPSVDAGPSVPGQETSAAPVTPPTGTTTRAVTPLVTFDQWTADTRTVSIGATVPGTVENDGVCHLSLTRSGVTVDGTFSALPSATSTDCGSMSLSSDSFTPGEWAVSVEYSSPVSAGTTDDYEVTIP